MKRAKFIIVILRINLFLVSIFIQGTITHDYEHDTPPLVSPVLYSHNEDEETDIEADGDRAHWGERDGDEEHWPEVEENRIIHLSSEHIATEREHIEDHIKNLTTMDTSKMTKNELEFHYFKLNDIDQDNHLDGLELIKSIIHLHWHGETQQSPKLHSRFHRKLSGNNGDHSDQRKIWSDRDLANMIDPILQQHDLNGDGLIDYIEYKSSLRG